MQEVKDKLETKINQMICSGEIKMRPKWYFLSLGILYAIGFILLFLIAILFISILLFKSRTLPPHKAYELLSSIETLPYIILSLFALLIVSVYMLKSNLSFIYKRPALTSTLLLIILLASLSYLVDVMTLHDKMEKRMRERPMMYLDRMYKPRMIMPESKIRVMQMIN